jgi:hypothetical protein
MVKRSPIFFFFSSLDLCNTLFFECSITEKEKCQTATNATEEIIYINLRRTVEVYKNLIIANQNQIANHHHHHHHHAVFFYRLKRGTSIRICKSRPIHFNKYALVPKFSGTNFEIPEGAELNVSNHLCIFYLPWDRERIAKPVFAVNINVGWQ